MYKIVVLTFVVTLGLIVGCSSKGSNVAANPAVLDVAPIPSPLPPAAPLFAEPALAAAPLPAEPAVTPSPVQPAMSVAPAPVTPAVLTAPAASGKYTVKKGDTLFSIAKTQLGAGGQWKRIVAANPGLSPKTLKAGQQIALPQ